VAHEHRKEAIAAALARGDTQTKVAKDFGYTPSGLNRLIKTSDMKERIRAYLAHNKQFHDHFSWVNRINALQAQDNYTRFLDPEKAPNTEIHYKASRDSIQFVEQERKVAQESDAGGGMDRETAKIVLETVERLARLQSALPVYDIESDPHLIDGSEAAKASLPVPTVPIDPSDRTEGAD
jgi:hypothetical protein